MKHKLTSLLVLLALMALPSVQAASHPQDDQAPPRTAELIRELYQNSSEQFAWLPIDRRSSQKTPTLPSGTPPSWSRLAFESYRNNNWDIYLANVDGLNEQRLTTESSIEIGPSLTRGASQALFASKRDGNYELYRVNTTGSGLQRLTSDPGSDTEPRWSPDSGRIAFQSTRTGNTDVFVMNADGSGVTQLTNSSAYDGAPSWSPDGSQLVFVSQRTGHYELWIMNANGTNQKQLTSGATAFDPVWSPTNNQIAFSNDSNADGWLEVWLVNSDGSGLSLLYSSGYNLDRHGPAWSPDGKWLAYIETNWLYYQGNWYWTTSYLRLQELIPYGGQISPINDDRIWSVDWASTDVTPPGACAIAASNPQKRWSSFVITWTAQDSGPAGVAAYDVQTRQANSTWVDLVANSGTTSLMYQGDDTGVVEMRCRARDVAGNIASWASAPITSVSIDAARPTSQIAVERAVKGTQVSVEWNGADKGSGIASYDVFVRDGTANDWTPWFQSITTTTAAFQGVIGHTYFFQSQAQDNIGHKEPWQPTPKAAVTFYAQRITGTLRDSRGVVALAAPQVQPAAAYSTTDEVTGDYSLYLGASGSYTLEVPSTAYGAFPPTPLTISDDASFPIVLPPVSNAIANGGFEAGTLAGWQIISDAGISVTQEQRYAGNYAMQFSPTTTDTLEASQSITINAALHQPTLSFLYRVPVALAGPFTVNVTGMTSTEVLSTSAVTAGWQHAWFDLAPYSGQTVTITFRLSGAAEAVSIDEVTVGSWTTPQILDVSPTEWLGPATTLVITGSNFLSTPVVFLGTTPLTELNWISPTQLLVRVPASMSAGQYPMRLVNPGGAATQWSSSLIVNWHRVWFPLIASSYKGAVIKETTDWLTLGGDPGRTGYRKLETGASRYTLAWTTTVTYAGGRPLAQIAVADGVVVASSDIPHATSVVVALDANSGQELWNYRFLGKNSLNPPAIGHGAVYVQEGNHATDSYLFCLDLYTGQKNWQAPFTAQWETYLAPLIVGQGVYVNGGYYGGMYGFNAGNGEQLWYVYLEQYDEWTPTYADGKLYTWVGGNFREHALSSGEVLWSVSAGLSGPGSNTAPVIDRQTALIVGSTGLNAINLDAHSVRWGSSGNYNATLPVIAEGVVYALKEHGLEARQLTDGTLLWAFAGDNGLVHAPIVAGKYVYVASDANTYVLNRETHTPVWQVNHGGWLTIANGYLYIAQADKTIYAYKAQEP